MRGKRKVTVPLPQTEASSSFLTVSLERPCKYDEEGFGMPYMYSFAHQEVFNFISDPILI